METIEYLRELNIVSMMLRIVLAMLMGGIIGFEREMKRRPAGFRTYMLVAIGSAMTVMLSQYLDYMLWHDWSDTAELVGIRTDVSRFGAQVINGVGFLGAGTILVTGHSQVKGLTTAAGLWASACMGIAVGAGFYECTIMGFVLIILSMVVFPQIENAMHLNSRSMNVYVELDGIEHLAGVINRIKSEGIEIYEVELNKDENVRLSGLSTLFYLKLNRKLSHTELLVELSKLDGVIATEEI